MLVGGMSSVEYDGVLNVEGGMPVGQTGSPAANALNAMNRDTAIGMRERNKGSPGKWDMDNGDRNKVFMT
jgi:hypothetical protein